MGDENGSFPHGEEQAAGVLSCVLFVAGLLPIVLLLFGNTLGLFFVLAIEFTAFVLGIFGRNTASGKTGLVLSALVLCATLWLFYVLAIGATRPPR